MEKIIFLDSEISIKSNEILDIGCITSDNLQFHFKNKDHLLKLSKDYTFICGHNFIHHDLKYLSKYISDSFSKKYIDTLYLSALLFPKKPYHCLSKDDKLDTNELNNPLNDAKKSMHLFCDEVNAFLNLESNLQKIYYFLLHDKNEFSGFFDFLKVKFSNLSIKLIQDEFKNEICENANLEDFVKQYPIELAYCLALIRFGDENSITPKWTMKTFPDIENIMKKLRGINCNKCNYCNEQLNAKKYLKKIFGYDNFREYDGKNLQEEAVNCAMEGKSLIAVFPTGGGKSLTFQLPALIQKEVSSSLTIVISPLQSLMKDQVDNLERRGITSVITINGLLDEIQRKNAYERLMDGSSSLLYISPEQLRSNSIQNALLARNIDRFVIDEAHCFSSWGHDFRVDYLYIGDFIKNLMDLKSNRNKVAISCFTATAKKHVIDDIKKYFKEKLNLDMQLFSTDVERKNLRYKVIYKETDEEKYTTMRDLIQAKNCPTIVYASRTATTEELERKLNRDGIYAKAFHGQMDVNEKIKNQDDFINNKIQVIVATSAFGMGVDKSDVRLVIHYDISNSLENYVQEAGRAGRDPNIDAQCYILYNDADLNKHFTLLNQSKLSMSEIQQVWKAIKNLTKNKPFFSSSALEIAREAGWNENIRDLESRVKIALGALENAKYIKRENNSTRVYATGILTKNMVVAIEEIENIQGISQIQKENSKRILSSLFTKRSSMNFGLDADSRVDFLSDILGIKKEDVIESINILKENKILADSKDMIARIFSSKIVAKRIINRFLAIEDIILQQLDSENVILDVKEINEHAINSGITTSTVQNIKTILLFLSIKKYIKKQDNSFVKKTIVYPQYPKNKLLESFNLRKDISKFLIEKLYENVDLSEKDAIVEFSLIEIFNDYKNYASNANVKLEDLEEAILYLSKIGAMSLEGSFLVIYNTMHISRIEKDNRVQYKIMDYKILKEHYNQKKQQIHIVGKYSHIMAENYEKALQFVKDYFQMGFKEFIIKYFDKAEQLDLERNISPKKYKELFEGLSPKQKEIINDDSSQFITVLAGAGSGKTKVLVHKLASLLLMEDVKPEQLLMLTFSRVAATEFKKRLIDLIGEGAYFVDIKTFHSYCFDILGQKGTVEKSQNIVPRAVEEILSMNVEQGQVTKSVIVIDEAQDMDEYSFKLLEAIISLNEGLRVIAVGDDDQNIYSFRGSSSKYMKFLIDKYGAKKYELVTNYRSSRKIVEFSDAFVKCIKNRIKSESCISYCDYYGIVSLTKYKSTNIQTPLIAQIKNSSDIKCILTNTNEEALKISAALKSYKINTKLLQTMENIKFSNLVEVRYFTKKINTEIGKNPASLTIPEVVWKSAKESLISKYKNSTALENCLNMIEDFENTNKAKFISDFEDFINESVFEDFYRQDNKSVFISTIHKSKGREFDTVYLIINGKVKDDDEEKRKIYVGLTRAKSTLNIHYNSNIFDNIDVKNIERIYDTSTYNNLREISIQLSYKDVILDYFKDKTYDIFSLISGNELLVENDYLSIKRGTKNIKVVKFSKSCKEKLNSYLQKGYRPYKSIVRFIVAWKDKVENKEYPIILADLYLKI